MHNKNYSITNSNSHLWREKIITYSMNLNLRLPYASFLLLNFYLASSIVYNRFFVLQIKSFFLLRLRFPTFFYFTFLVFFHLIYFDEPMARLDLIKKNHVFCKTSHNALHTFRAKNETSKNPKTYLSFIFSLNKLCTLNG